MKDYKIFFFSPRGFANEGTYVKITLDEVESNEFKNYEDKFLSLNQNTQIHEIESYPHPHLISFLPTLEDLINPY